MYHRERRKREETIKRLKSTIPTSMTDSWQKYSDESQSLLFLLSFIVNISWNIVLFYFVF
jgi:hypothetical protein